MPFVKRDTSGAIQAVCASPDGECHEEVPADDPSLAVFLASLQPEQAAIADTDQGFVRVLEDVIDLLIERDVFQLQDLPQDARDKLQRRKALRSKLVR